MALWDTTAGWDSQRRLRPSACHSVVMQRGVKGQEKQWATAGSCALQCEPALSVLVWASLPKQVTARLICPLAFFVISNKLIRLLHYHLLSRVGVKNHLFDVQAERTKLLWAL